MKPELSASALILILAGFGARGATVLVNEHVDVDVAYDLTGRTWELILHDETHDVELEPADTTIQVGARAQVSNPHAFLGPLGVPVWILPQVEDPELVFLGTSGEEVADGIFEGDAMTLSLAGVSGPGDFALYSVSGFNEITVFMNSRDGVTPDDRVPVLAGGHTDYNWSFTAPGEYSISFQASGRLVPSGELTTSDAVPYRFSVIPEPRASVILALGTAALFLGRRIRPPTPRCY